MTRPIDRTGLARKLRQPPVINRRAENALACLFIIACIAGAIFL
jgi:hypothetical protein